MIKTEIYAEKYKQLLPELSERARRLVVAADARLLGRGGISFVHKVSGISRVTITKGIAELDAEVTLPTERDRQPGAGRKQLTDTDPKLTDALLALVETTARGDPEQALKWTIKSTRVLAKELAAEQHVISHTAVAGLLTRNGYSLQSNQKTKEGSATHPDRDQQFHHINSVIEEYARTGDPCISVDTKKKELVGNYKNQGQTWLPKGQPVQVNGHDFPGTEGKAVPYGIYDLKQNDGYVNVGINHDTGEFAVASIHRWWKQFGKERYRKAKRLLITADSGGSNGYRLRLWKKELQALTNKTGLSITVCHLPPGTSKWNKIEHKLFSFISTNWKGRPLTSYQVIISLIAATKTEAGLKVYAELDDHEYRLQRKVSDEEMQHLNLLPDVFHGEWNYTIRPGVLES